MTAGLSTKFVLTLSLDLEEFNVPSFDDALTLSPLLLTCLLQRYVGCQMLDIAAK